MPSMCTRCQLNGNYNEQPQNQPTLLIFKTQETLMESRKHRYLTDKKLHATHLYILVNCDEVQPYIESVVFICNKIYTLLYIIS